MQGIQPLFKQGKWYLSALLSGIAVLLYLATEYTIITFIRGGLMLSPGTMRMMAWTSFLTMLFSPLIFWMLFIFAKFCDHSINPEAANKRRRPR
jgi:hypothetical protein